MFIFVVSLGVVIYFVVELKSKKIIWFILFFLMLYKSLKCLLKILLCFDWLILRVLKDIIDFVFFFFLEIYENEIGKYINIFLFKKKEVNRFVYNEVIYWYLMKVLGV